jgi:hypothetical protein
MSPKHKWLHDEVAAEVSSSVKKLKLKLILKSQAEATLNGAHKRKFADEIASLRESLQALLSLTMPAASRQRSSSDSSQEAEIHPQWVSSSHQEACH